MTTQREKDMSHRRKHPTKSAHTDAFADGCEHGRADLAKLERLAENAIAVRIIVYRGAPPGKRIHLTIAQSESSTSGRETVYRGATLAEALAQVEE